MEFWVVSDNAVLSGPDNIDCLAFYFEVFGDEDDFV